MALVKTVTEDKIEIVGEYKAVQVRTATTVKEDGVQIGQSFHRHVLHPGTLNDSDALVATDISGEDAEVQAVANAVWTDAVKLAWKNKLIADKG